MSTDLVTKAEALTIVSDFIDRPGVIDVPDLIELFKWQNKLILWLLQERKEQATGITIPEAC